jgi:hypothetical protein
VKGNIMKIRICAFSAILATSLLSIMPGCWAPADGLARLDELYPLPDAGPQPDLCGEDGGTSDIGCVGGSVLPGRWAMTLVQKGKIDIIQEKVEVNDLFLADFSQDSMTATLTYCGGKVVTPSGWGEEQFPAVLITALQAAPLTIKYAKPGCLQACQVPWLWGVKGLENPVTDPLPVSPSDATVWDQDGDQLPGVTLHILKPLGDRYMARRAVWYFRNGVVSDDGKTITGRLNFTIDEKALGASTEILKTVAPITPNNVTSYYELKKIANTAACSDVQN